MAVVVSIDDSIVATISGSRYSGNVAVAGAGSFEQGISGSLTRLTNGTSYLLPGSCISIVSASNGQITIAETAGDTLASYLTLAATSSISQERVLTSSFGISLTDAGAGGNLTINAVTAQLNEFFHCMISNLTLVMDDRVNFTGARSVLGLDPYYHTQYHNPSEVRTAYLGTTTLCSRSYGINYYTITAANSVAGFQTRESDRYIVDGFHSWFLFGCEDFSSSATMRCFVGLSKLLQYSTVLNVISGTNSLTVLTSSIGVCFDVGDSAFSIIHNDGTGDPTKVSTGVPCVDGEVYYLQLKCQMTGVCSWSFTQLSSSNIASGVITTDLPSSGTGLAYHFAINNGTNGGQVGIRYIQHGGSNVPELSGYSMFDSA